MHQAASRVPPLINSYRRVRDFTKTDPLVTAIFRKTFERNRLTLPIVEPEMLSSEAGLVVFPTSHPLFASMDAPLNDLMFLLNLAKGRKVKRILEVGTYRARTTLAFHLNCPDAVVVSYDVQVLDSPYRKSIEGNPRIFLRHASFSGSAETLRNEPPFDLIFVDGSHRFAHVLEDSRLALECVETGGVVIWHDYRTNDYANDEMRVPEALDVVRRDFPIFAVVGTTCAVHSNEK
jgi:predicted O-methyltransferase YrrM